MKQVTIYLDVEIERKARAAARVEGISLNRWVANRIAIVTRGEWPVLVRNLAGAWADLPSVKRIRSGSGRDSRRAAL